VTARDWLLLIGAVLIGAGGVVLWVVFLTAVRAC
jgi:hypothetical protein